MILGIIVTYNPNFENFFKNFKSILPQVDYLLIFDNNSSNKEELNKLESFENVGLFFSDFNVGLGCAYNYAIKNFKFDYLVTFDQDTFLSDFCIKNLMSHFSNPNLGIIGPSFSFSNFNKSAVSDVTVLIQSCSIFKSEIFKNVGMFNESYFIDSLDFEFCLRAKAKGYQIIRDNCVYIYHELGKSNKTLGLNYTSHNEIRNFFIARNHVDLTIRFFFKFPIFIFKKNIFFLLHLCQLIILERNLNKIKLFCIGLINGFKQQFVFRL